MRLGIVVVYLVKEENEKLLDLHLDRIERHTQVPYTIYASVNRLLPILRKKLEQHPKVKILECEPTDLRGSNEHAFYLEQLVKRAVDDGASHIVTLHVDSFPIRSDWADELAGKLSDVCVLAAIMREKEYDKKPHTACIFFHRDFYLKYRPTFHLSRSELSSPLYRKYLGEFGPVPDSGIGYGFRAYSEGLSWYPLQRSNKGEDHFQLGGIYGDLIFHLGSAVREIKCFPGDDAQPLEIGKMRGAFVTLRKCGAPLLPDKVREKVDLFFPRRFLDLFFPQYSTNQKAFDHIKKYLLNDPEAYIHYLRTGQRR